MAKKQQSTIIQALNFVSVAQAKEGAPFQTHCRIANNEIVTFNGILAAGHKIEEDLVACPHTLSLKSALEQCGDKLSITQLNLGELLVKSGKLKVNIPCYPDELPVAVPDLQICPIDDRIKVGLGVVSPLAKEEAQKVVFTAILLTSGSMQATTGFVLLEYWHGISLPTVILPKVFATAVSNTDKKLTGFGYSENSVTFHFEDSSWFKTQLYNEQWPMELNSVLNRECNPEPLAKDFYKALRSIEDFAEGGKEKGTVKFTAEGLATTKASYELKGLPEGKAFKIKQLKQIEDSVKTVDWNKHPAMFFGDNVRGLIMGVTL